ncbi:MAG: 5-(carboxyamino)imidazole ribonucleotide mutase [Chloroflexi bacterium]|jgi:5-(carboxyamino)imidazole ribonucleotide mutase|nr:5-(carboxyamino)imidazole ribonucleotide mutase [Chloroflexota bacterium]MBT7080763.1 5-(carboxyamino)imidazole ribonucleotide mutase [Chloroflexota bacterium]MBT7289566.1 5-(carboxyamino)imidazole ribonucleotide mutase [Chloroflexota bacterium]
MALVGVVIGSKSDEDQIKPALDMLRELGVTYEFSVISAHRTPEKAREYASSAAERGIEVLIGGAGKAAHLPGVLASWTILPVIGIPLVSGDMAGLDALLSIVQMPSGVPVGCMSIGGAKNAAVFAAGILALKYDSIKQAILAYRKKLSE